MLGESRVGGGVLPDVDPTDIDKMVSQEVGKLAAMCRSHIVEEAQLKLKSRFDMFVESLRLVRLGDQAWAVELDARAVWIDEGLPARNLLDVLLAGPKARRAKDGHKFAIVPFQIGPRAASRSTPAQTALLEALKGELKARGIPYTGIEKNDGGEAKLGLLHSFDVGGPIRQPGLKLGSGLEGLIAQGWSADKKSGTPLLAGIRVYQRLGPRGGVRREQVTFRVASEKHRGDSGRWEHPGVRATHLFDEAAAWALKQWDESIAPDIARKLTINVGR